MNCCQVITEFLQDLCQVDCTCPTRRCEKDRCIIHIGSCGGSLVFTLHDFIQDLILDFPGSIDHVCYKPNQEN